MRRFLNFNVLPSSVYSLHSTERLLQLVKLCAAQIHDLQIDIACSLAPQMHRCTGCVNIVDKQLLQHKF